MIESKGNQMNGIIMDDWIKRKIGLDEKEPLSRAAIEAYQLDKLVDTIRMAKERSIFYRELLKDIDPDSIRNLKDLEKLPFVTPDDLREKGKDMLCVRNSEISRIVTLDTSGTTANPKRIFYTEEDQELTIDFFHYGMRNLVDETDVVLILMPCARPGSVGDLLDIGLQRLGSGTVAYGLLKPDYSDLSDVLRIMEKEGVTCIVGAPTQVDELARVSAEQSEQAEWKENYLQISTNMRTVLLSSEYVPDPTCDLISRVWGCRVF